MLAARPDFVHRKNLKKNFLVIDDEVGARLSPLENYFISISLIAVVSLAVLNIVPLMKGLAFMLVGMLILGTVKGAELRRTVTSRMPTGGTGLQNCPSIQR